MKKFSLDFSAINAGQWVVTALRGREKDTHQVKTVDIAHIILGRQRFDRRTGFHEPTGRKIVALASEEDIKRAQAFGWF